MHDIVGEAIPERREGQAASGSGDSREPTREARREPSGEPPREPPLVARPSAIWPSLPGPFLEKLCWPPAFTAQGQSPGQFDNAVDPPETCSAPDWSLAAAQAYCRELARKHYENFTVAGWLTPTELRQPIADIYAFCRWADDLADELPGSAAQRLAALDWWQAQLADCWQPLTAPAPVPAPSSPPASPPASSPVTSPAPAPASSSHRSHRLDRVHPVFVALRETRERFDLEVSPFLALLTAFRQDQTCTRYDTWEQVLDYCRNSAAPVGRLLLRLARLDDRREVKLGEWSDAICSGLQIANFCQDLRGDWQRGRIYLPRESWARQGCVESDFTDVTAAKWAPVVREGVEFAERLFEAGRPLLTVGPAWLRSDLALFLGGGQAILQAIRARRYDVWSTRPTVSRWAKWRLLPTAIRAFLAARQAS